MGKILLFVSSKENARLLMDAISQLHEVVVTQDESDLQTDFDLAIIDGIALSRHSALLQARKQAVDPFFLPILLITSRQDVSLATRHLWETVDDLVLSPVERVDLAASIEILMRARQQSFQLGAINDQLRSEIEQRRDVEAQLSANLAQTKELYRVTRNMTMGFTPQELLDVFVSLEVLQPICFASIWKFSEASENMPPEAYEVLATYPTPLAAQTDTDRATVEPQRLPLPFLTSKPLVIGDIASDPIFSHLIDVASPVPESRSVMLLPLLIRGEPFALLKLHSSILNQWSDDTPKQLGSLVEQLAVELNNYLLFQAETQARQRAEEADRLKSRFLAIVSHELRTPLVPIKQFADLIVREITTNRRVMEYTGIIHHEVDNLHDLIGQLVDFVQLDNAQFHIEKAPVQLDEIIHFAQAQLTALTKNHELIYDLPPNLPPLWVDTKRIAQVMVNLVTNAVKYSPEQMPITVKARAMGDYVHVSVIDQGAGIPQHSRAVVFEAFSRLKEKTRQPGLGLGLAICKGIIEAHQGRIWIEDTPDIAGTTFTFLLPVAAAV